MPVQSVKDKLVAAGMWSGLADEVVGRATTSVTGDTVSAKGTAGTGITAVEFGNDWFHATRLTLSSQAVTITDDAGVAQYGGCGTIYTFPQGMIVILGAVIDGTVTLGTTGTITTTWAGGVALGTVTATTGATLTGTEANILPEVNVAAATASVGTIDAVPVATALTESGARWLDGTSTAIPMFLNLVVDDHATHTSGTGTCSATVTFLWLWLGDK